MAISVTSIAVNGGGGAATQAVTVGVGGVPLGVCIFVETNEHNTSAGVGGSVTDTAGNGPVSGSYRVAQQKLLNSSSANGFVSLFYCENAAALVNGDTITYTLMTANVGACVSAFYATGIVTASDPRDVHSGNGGSSTGAALTSGTPATSGDLFIDVIGWYGAATTLSQPTGWATPPNQATQGTTPAISRVSGGFFVATDQTTKTYTPTLSNSVLWGQVLCSFSPLNILTIDLSGVLELSASPTSDWIGPAVFGASLKNDAVAIAEFGVGLKGDILTPSVANVSLRGDVLSLTAFLASLNCDAAQGIEAGSLSRADQIGPIEAAVGLRRTATILADFGVGFARDALVPIEPAAKLRDDSSSTLDFLAQPFADVKGPAEFAVGMFSDGSGLIDFEGDVQIVFGNVAPTEWGANLLLDISSVHDTGAGARADSCLKFDSLATTFADSSGDEEFGIALVVDTSGMPETGTGVAGDGLANMSVSAGAATDIAAALEFITNTYADIYAATDISIVAIADGFALIETGVGMAGDGVIPADLLANLRSDDPAGIELPSLLTADETWDVEFAADLSIDSLASADYLAALLADGTQPVETVSSIVRDDAPRFEWRSNFAATVEAQADFGVRLDVSATIPAEYLISLSAQGIAAIEWGDDLTISGTHTFPLEWRSGAEADVIASVAVSSQLVADGQSGLDLSSSARGDLIAFLEFESSSAIVFGIIPPVEWGLGLLADNLGSAATLAKLRSKNSANAEIVASLTADESVVAEFNVSLACQAIALLEFGWSLAADISNQASIYASLQFDGIAPSGHLSSFNIGARCPVAFGSNFVSDIAVPIDSAGALNADGMGLIGAGSNIAVDQCGKPEWLASLSARYTGPIAFAASIRRETVVPVSWDANIAILFAEGIAPIEWCIGLRTHGVARIEWSGTVFLYDPRLYVQVDARSRVATVDSRSRGVLVDERSRDLTAQ